MKYEAGDQTAVGSILLDGKIRRIQVEKPLLTPDAPTWLEHTRKRLIQEAESAVADGDDVFAREMRQSADEISELLASRSTARLEGVWPAVEKRARLRSWSIKTISDARSYAQELVDYSETSESAAEDEFLFVVSEAMAKLYVSKGLFALARHSGIVQVQVVEVPELTMLSAKFRSEVGSHE